MIAKTFQSVQSIKQSSCKLLVALAVGVCSVSAFAQGAKLGFISLERVTTESTQAKSASAKLAQEFSKRETELKNLGEVLKTTSDKFEKDALTLPDAQRADRQKQLMELDRDLDRKSVV